MNENQVSNRPRSVLSILLRRNNNVDLPNHAKDSFDLVFKTLDEFWIFFQTVDFENLKTVVYLNGRSKTGKTTCASGLADYPGMRRGFISAVAADANKKYPDSVTIRMLNYNQKGIYDVVHNFQTKKLNLFVPTSQQWSSELKRAPSSVFPKLMKFIKQPGTYYNPHSTRTFTIEIWNSATTNLTILDFPGAENSKQMVPSKTDTTSHPVLTGKDQTMSSAFIAIQSSELRRVLKSKSMPNCFGIAKAVMSTIGGADKMIIITTASEDINGDLNKSIIDMQDALKIWWSHSHNKETISLLTKTPLETRTRKNVSARMVSSTPNFSSVEPIRKAKSIIQGISPFAAVKFAGRDSQKLSNYPDAFLAGPSRSVGETASNLQLPNTLGLEDAVSGSERSSSVDESLAKLFASIDRGEEATENSLEVSRFQILVDVFANDGSADNSGQSAGEATGNSSNDISLAELFASIDLAEPARENVQEAVMGPSRIRLRHRIPSNDTSFVCHFDDEALEDRTFVKPVIGRKYPVELLYWNSSRSFSVVLQRNVEYQRWHMNRINTASRFSFSLPRDRIQNGIMCLVSKNDIHQRGKILSVTEQYAIVDLMDVGVTKRYRFSTLKELPQDLQKAPPFAIRCRMALPNHFTDENVAKVIKKNTILPKYFEIVPVRRDQENAYSINLYVTEDVTDLLQIELNNDVDANEDNPLRVEDVNRPVFDREECIANHEENWAGGCVIWRPKAYKNLHKDRHWIARNNQLLCATEDCHYVAKTEGVMKDHILSQHMDLKYICDTCLRRNKKETFASTRSLINHNTRKHARNPVPIIE